MQKINFEDYPSTNTPIDADNLNDLQDNVEDAINLVQENLTPVVLFIGTSTTKDNITLNDSAANYTYLEIFYHTAIATSSYESTKIYNPNGKNINLSSVHRDTSQGVLFFMSKLMLINGTQITTTRIGQSYVYNGSENSISETDSIVIDRVIGYK